MRSENPGSDGFPAVPYLQFANRNAQDGGAVVQLVQGANRRTGSQRLRHASALLTDAVMELESAAASTIDGDERADLYEAIGAIVEGLQMIATANSDHGMK